MATDEHGWTRMGKELEMGAGEVHLILAETDGADEGKWRAHLTPDECERAGRLRIPAKREEFIISRGILRWVLAPHVGCAANSVLFLTGNHGKPSLEAGGPRFNLSHTAGRILIALSRDRQVGVDIERFRERTECEELAKRFFAAEECRALAKIPADEKTAAFFRCWTRKEAILKASGKGIAGGLDSFVVPLGAGLPREVAGWELHDLPVGEGYAAAVAVEGVGAKLKCWQMN